MVNMNQDQSLSSNNDESFVVLERCTEETVANGRKSADMSGSFLPSTATATNSVINPNFSMGSIILPPINTAPIPSIDTVMSMNSDEIQKRLQDLIKENADLKVTIQQHNLAMKQQFQTLKKWQDEVYKVHQTHKTKFEETKQFINKISAENKELKKALSECPQGEAQTNEANAKLLAENTALQKQNGVLQEKLNAALQRDKKYMQPSSKEAELTSVIEQLTKQLETAERAKRQLSIDNERLTALQSRMHPPIGAPIAMLHGSQYNDHIQPVEEQLKRYNEWLQRLEKMEEEINGSIMSSWMPVESGNAAFEVLELRKLLVEEQRLSTLRKEAIVEVRECFQRFLTDYQTLYHDWEWLKQESAKERDTAYDEIQRNGFRDKVDNLTAQLVEYKEALKDKTSYIESLKGQVQSLQTENESIEILKAQVNVYQTDFEAERKSREELVSVREKLLQDLRVLQRRNQQLIDELKVHQDNNQFNGRQNIQRRSVSHSPSPSPSITDVQSVAQSNQLREQQTPPQKYLCPNPECNVAFDSVTPLERHVVECLKLED